MLATVICLVLLSLLAHCAEAFKPSIRGVSRAKSGSYLQMNNVRKAPNKRDKMIKNALESVEFSRKPLSPEVALMDDPLIPMVSAIVNAADQRKASAIAAFRVASISEITTFMIVVEGNSRPQNQAIALAVEDAVLLDFTSQPSKQGDSGSGWILLDYGSVIVHIMTPQMRNFYKLEKRWKDAEVIDVSSLIKDNMGAAAAGGEEEVIDEEVEDETDPFWQ